MLICSFLYATVRNISEKRLLILYFCAVSAVQNGKLTPQYIVFQAHDDFITLEYCENGKSKWRQAKTKALGKDCHSFYTECAFYNHAEELKVIRFCGNSQKEKGFNTLEQLQENLACKREQSRKRAKEAKIKERMKPVKPLPERSLKKWLQKEYALPSGSRGAFAETRQRVCLPFLRLDSNLSCTGTKILCFRQDNRSLSAKTRGGTACSYLQGIGIIQ